MQFLDLVDEALTEAELGMLCRQFGVAFGAFPGLSKREKTREFLGYVKRQGRLAGLADATVAMRPDLTEAVAQLYGDKEEELAWLDQIAGGEGQPLDSGLTWRWASSSGVRPNSDPAGKPAPTMGSGEATPIELDDAHSRKMPNPYTPGLMISDEAMFFGRRAEREQARQLLQAGEHVAIIGGRGMGSSSFLHRVYRDMSNVAKFLVAYIDMKDPAYHTLPGLLNSIWTQWWAGVKPGNTVPVRTLAEFVTAVRKLHAAGFRPVLLLDELEQLTWRPAIFDDDLFGAWHELGREKLVGFAVTAHTSLLDLSAQGEYRPQFFELLQQINLGLLDETAARQLLSEPCRAAGFVVPEGAVEYLYLHAGPHPFFLQLAGFYLFEALAQSIYSRGEVIRQFEMAAEPYWQEMWESLSPLAQAHFPTSQARMSDGMGGRQLRIMANRGLVFADDSGFHPFSDGFARWLARMQAAIESAAAVAVSSTAV